MSALIVYKHGKAFGIYEDFRESESKVLEVCGITWIVRAPSMIDWAPGRFCHCVDSDPEAIFYE